MSARELIARGRPTSWPDILASDVDGVMIRWQYANEDGPCRRDDADRILLPFAHGRVPKGTQLPIKPGVG